VDSQEVLASWLFAQYMLSNEVQIAYASTEGYVPVTLKAQNSDAYQDYLARIGEDNDLHYSVKIQASQLLLENTQHTFVTPVYNGSASLRNAAGQMIEDVTKSVRRKKAVDDTFIEKLYADMTSLYRLDQIQAQNAGVVGGDDMGPLPQTARLLLGGISFVWIVMGVYATNHVFKKKK